MRSDIVLVGFMVRLFVSIHSVTLCSSEFARRCKLLILSDENIKVVSSAKNLGTVCKQLRRSLIYIKNRRGPNIDP